MWVSPEIQLESGKGQMEKVPELGPSVAGGAVTRSERLGIRACQRPGKAEAWRQEGLYLEVQSS